MIKFSDGLVLLYCSTLKFNDSNRYQLQIVELIEVYASRASYIVLCVA